MSFFRLLLISSILLSSAFGEDTRSFKEFIDASINPCQDFYEYACGKWTPQNSEATDVINDQRLENRKIIKAHYRSLHNKNIQDEHPPSKFYYLCLNSKMQPEEEILSNYLSTLLSIEPEWPYLNQTFKGSSYDKLEVAAKLRHYQVNTLFKISVQRNWKESEQNHHVLYLTHLKKPFVGPADGDEAFVYKTYVKYLLLAFGVRVRKANEYAQEVVDFEFELDNLHRDIEDVLIDPIPVEKLIEQFPGSNWKLYFDTLLSRTKIRPANRVPMVVVPHELLKKLEKLLAKTKPETIALHQLAKFLQHYQVKMDPPNWIDCIDEVNEMMPLSVANDFEQFTFDDFSPREVFNSLQDEFIDQINKTNWYSDKSKAEIINKLEDLRLHIGISDVAIQLDPEVEIEQKNFQQARMAFDKLAADNEFYQLNLYNKLASKALKPLKVNAYFKLSTNALEIPIGLLRSPLYNENSSLAQVMGSLGSIFAHELVHGLDFDGQNYDNRGNVKMDVNPKEIIEFGKRAGCFVDQYSGGKVKALNEDVADSEGLRLAYGAFEKMKDTKYKADSKFNDKQLFFLSYAQIWCQANSSSNQAINHSSHKDRVNNVVSNSEKFAEAFACSKDSPLNPVKKCQIW
ncbi:neprilysin-2-like [Eupeodes corollae]|uniref:neprilysin-2-like n=1 Tax=Eupeodes corollae TaxID=290404 RepID=UPI00249269FC|nr:neprilysin-2-like [Eupeodes corollae]